MPVFPQTMNAKLVEFANVTAQSASYAASSGDIAVITTAGGTITVTLPPVAQGGPVTVKKIDAGVGVIKVVTSDLSTIDGIAGATGRTQASTQFLSWTFVSDGSAAWYQVW